MLDEATERLDALRESSGTAILWLRLADVRLRRGDFAAARELSRARASRTPTCAATRAC